MRRRLMILTALAVAVGGFLLLRQAPPPAEADVLFPAQDESGLARISTYEGRLPCEFADCDKVKVAIALYGTDSLQPERYRLARVRVDGSNDRDLFAGALSIARGIPGYPDAAVWQLNAEAPSEYGRLWPVTSEILLILDESLKPRPGTPSWGRMLSRVE